MVKSGHEPPLRRALKVKILLNHGQSAKKNLNAGLLLVGTVASSSFSRVAGSGAIAKSNRRQYAPGSRYL